MQMQKVIFCITLLLFIINFVSGDAVVHSSNNSTVDSFHQNDDDDYTSGIAVDSVPMDSASIQNNQRFVVFKSIFWQ